METNTHTTETKMNLTNKRLDKRTGRYLVDATCNNCGRRHALSFGYWSAIVCQGCRRVGTRTPYRRA